MGLDRNFVIAYLKERLNVENLAVPPHTIHRYEDPSLWVHNTVIERMLNSIENGEWASELSWAEHAVQHLLPVSMDPINTKFLHPCRDQTMNLCRDTVPSLLKNGIQTDNMKNFVENLSDIYKIPTPTVIFREDAREKRGGWYTRENTSLTLLRNLPTAFVIHASIHEFTHHVQWETKDPDPDKRKMIRLGLRQSQIGSKLKRDSDTETALLGEALYTLSVAEQDAEMSPRINLEGLIQRQKVPTVELRI